MSIIDDSEHVADFADLGIIAFTTTRQVGTFGMMGAEPVGEEPIGPNDNIDPGAPIRGWITLASAPPSMQEHDPLIVVQHPLLPGKLTQLPVQLAIGRILSLPYNELRVRHNARTLGGSSGSPCLNANLELVALHHAGDAVTEWEPDPRFNQAIPVRRIVADLVADRIQPAFWDQPPA